MQDGLLEPSICPTNYMVGYCIQDGDDGSGSFSWRRCSEGLDILSVGLIPSGRHRCRSRVASLTRKVATIGGHDIMSSTTILSTSKPYAFYFSLVCDCEIIL